MRIAMISEHANPLAALGGVDAGGQNLHVAELSAALVRAGHDVTVYSRRDARGQPTTVDAPQGYRVVHVPAGPAKQVPKDELLPHMAEFTRFVSRQWRDSPPDVVHSHFWMSGIVAVFAKLHAQTPVVHTYHALGTVKRRHQGSADTSPADRVRLERLVGNSATRVLATCTDEVRELGRMGVGNRRVSVVPCGVDCDQFRPEGPAVPKRLPRRVVSVGRLVPRKGFADLIAAMPHNPDTELVIVGGPDRRHLARDPEAVRLRELAERLGVADRVRLVGQVPRERMPAVLRSADLVACVPWYEPFGIVPLEAMACGVPVLATAVGGLADTVVDGVTGVLVPPRRPKSLATTMNALLADPVKRDFLGAAGRDRAECRYPWDRIALDTARVYEQCLEGTVGIPGDGPLAAAAGGPR
ncbi:MAG TPA: glycosyltransferase [Actinophytocola sp.]|nr:glycosyltransferase [Actinophytocola sp.]